MTRPRQHDERTVTTAVRLPPEVHERLKAAAEERDLSMNWMINRAVERFLERLIPVDELKFAKGEGLMSAETRAKQLTEAIAEMNEDFPDWEWIARTLVDTASEYLSVLESASPPDYASDPPFGPRRIDNWR